MKYNDLLGKAWLKVATKDQKRALREAYQAGREAAEEALQTEDGAGLPYCLAEDELIDFYFIYLIENEEFCKELEFSDQAYWVLMWVYDVEQPNDPRIDPFCKGWRSFMKEELLRLHPEVAEVVAAINDLIRQSFTDR